MVSKKQLWPEPSVVGVKTEPVQIVAFPVLAAAQEASQDEALPRYVAMLFESSTLVSQRIRNVYV